MRLGFIQNYGFGPQSPTASSVTSPASRFTSNSSSTSSGSDPKQRLGSRQPSNISQDRTPPSNGGRFQQTFRQPKKPTPQSKPKPVNEDQVKPSNQQLVSEQQQKDVMVAEFMTLLEMYKADKSAAGKVAEFYDLILESNLFKEAELLVLKAQAEAISDEYDRLEAEALAAMQPADRSTPGPMEQISKPAISPFTPEEIKQVALMYHRRMRTDSTSYPIADDDWINMLIMKGRLPAAEYALFQQEVAALQAADQPPVHTATNVAPTNVQPMSTAAATSATPATEKEEKEWYQKTSNQIIMGVALLALGFGATKLIK